MSDTTRNIRVHNTDGKRWLNLFNIAIIDGEIDWSDVETSLPDGWTLDGITMGVNEIDNDGNLL